MRKTNKQSSHKKTFQQKENIKAIKKPNSNSAEITNLNRVGLIFYKERKYELALRYFRQIIALEPTSTETHFNIGAILQIINKDDEALKSYETAIQLNPNHIAAINNRANILLKMGRVYDALECYEQSLKKQPSHLESNLNKGHALFLLKEYEQSARSYQAAITIAPKHAEAYHRRGLCLQHLKKEEQALDSYKKAIEIEPRFVEAICCHAEILLAKGKAEEALNQYATAARLKPGNIIALMGQGDSLFALMNAKGAIDFYKAALDQKHDLAEAHNNIGAALISLENYKEAIKHLKTALNIKHDFTNALSNLGNAYLKINEPKNAIEYLDIALKIDPNHESAILNKLLALAELGRYDETLNFFDNLLAAKPDNAKLHNGKAYALMKQGRYNDAISCAEKAIELDPGNHEAHCNLGVAMMNFWRLDAAVGFFEQALEKCPNDNEVKATILSNLGVALTRLKHLDRAASTFQKILAIKSDQKLTTGTHFHVNMQMCKWDNFESELSNIVRSINEDLNVIYPFPLLALTDDTKLHKKVAFNYAKHTQYRKGELSHLKPIEAKTDKIRIGYYSADFHNHATAYLIAELIERHDRNCFEIYGFSYGPNGGDEMKNRLYQAFDEYIDVSQYGDRQVASLSRVLGIDIAVDLKGYTEGSRMSIFIERCAPIQISYLGYPGTTMLPEIDYVIGDHIVTPEGCESDYSEKIIRLPNCYQVNDSKRRISDKIFTRDELGLPKHGTIFCCFNNNYKILPETFDSWMRIIGSVPGSVLWLLSDNIWAEANLQKEAKSRGIDPSRLIFAKRMPLDMHLARFRQADIFLDTFPYNAHTTASDALWAGIPVLTRSGKSFASRVAASLLTNIGLPELITTNQHQYEKKAVELATNPRLLKSIKTKIQLNQTSTPLFDIINFTEDFENILIKIHQQTSTQKISKECLHNPVVDRQI